jgi:DUF971 family protein
MRLQDIQLIGNEMAVKWEDGREDFILLEVLRRACPCAGCKGETDILGHVYRNPPTPYVPNAFLLSRLKFIGGYAIAPVWADGHDSGIFSYDYLRSLGAK